MRARLPSTRTLPDATAVLWLLLAAAVAVPLPATLAGWWMPIPFGLSFRELGALAIAAAVARVASRAYAGRRRGRWRGTWRGLGDVAATGVLASLFAWLVEWRSTGFYTEIALFEGMVALLLLHLVATLLRAFGAGGAGGAPGGVGAVPAMSAGTFADRATTAVAWLVMAFWVLTAFAWRETALALLMFASAGELLAMILRLPDAVRGARSRTGGMRGDDARAA